MRFTCVDSGNLLWARFGDGYLVGRLFCFLKRRVTHWSPLLLFQRITKAHKKSTQTLSRDSNTGLQRSLIIETRFFIYLPVDCTHTTRVLARLYSVVQRVYKFHTRVAQTQHTSTLHSREFRPRHARLILQKSQEKTCTNWRHMRTVKNGIRWPKFARKEISNYSQKRASLDFPPEVYRVCGELEDHPVQFRSKLDLAPQPRAVCVCLCVCACGRVCGR